MKYLITIFAIISGVLAHASGTLVPRAEFSKPEHIEIRDVDRWDLLVVKFREGTGVRLRDDRFVSYANADLSSIEQLLKAYPETRLARLFSRPEADYELERRTGEARTGRQLADLNLYYAFGPSDRETAQKLVNDLNQLDIIECVYPEPIPELAFMPSESRLMPPSYVEFQDYLGTSPVGVDAEAAWPLPGGRGQNVKMIDVELGWAWTHIDLPEPFFEGGNPSPSQSYRDHGTAVVGIIAGIDNEYGITGISPETAVGGQAISIGNYPDNVGMYFDQASAALEPGDVWLIELHAPGPDGKYIAMEWWQANYDAIANSTAQGRICVQAGGNGQADFDSPLYEGKFDRNVRDSLAIMVGAGTPYQMQPEWFTNYGSRMDANGWGSQIYTTGYGDLYNQGGEDYYFTYSFGGTSGASPMVVGVACIAQSIYKELTGGAVLDPLTLRTAITETGAPQPDPVTQYIGPRPNLADLIEHEIFEVEGIYMDRSQYTCDAQVELLVRDPNAQGTVTAVLSSATEPGGETVILDETEPGIFTALVSLTTDPPVPGDGQVSVTHGDLLTAEYSPLDSEATADVDCVAPIISDVDVSTITDLSFTVTWTTDKPANSMIHYGEGTPDQTVIRTTLVTEHNVVVDNLDEGTHYVFSVASEDTAGNIALDDNDGNFYGVTTLYTLWNQPASPSSPGRFANQDFPDFSDYNTYIADDFVNTETWLITQIFVPGELYNNGTSLMNASSLHWMIYADDAGFPAGDPSGGGNPPFWSLELTPSDIKVDLTHGIGGLSDTTLTLETPVELPAGTWWLIFYPTMNFTPHGQYARISSDTENLEVAKLINPGGAFGYGTGWQNWTVTGVTQHDVAFRIGGALPGAATPTPFPTHTPSPPTPTPTPDCIHHGDVNMDGVVTAEDAQIAFQIALNIYSPTYEEECAADCNGDGVVTAADAQQIFLTALGADTCFDEL